MLDHYLANEQGYETGRSITAQIGVFSRWHRIKTEEPLILQPGHSRNSIDPENADAFSAAVPKRESRRSAVAQLRRRANRVYLPTMVARSAILRLGAALLVTGAMPVVAKPLAVSQPQVAHYKAMTPAEAETLIAKLKDAQSKMKAGDNLTFELLTGAPASYPTTEVSPRQSFLAMSFGRPYAVERFPKTGLWQHYQLTYFPPGLDTLMWKVDVTTGQLAELVRVEMFYTAPPPF